MVVSCVKCDEPDTEDMVQCDDCDDWWHYECAKVKDEVKDNLWSCSACISKQKKEAKKKRDENISALVGHETALKFHVTYFANTDASTITLEGYECRLAAILPMFEKYQSHFMSLFALLQEKEAPKYESQANAFANDYFTLVASLQEKIREKKNALTAATPIHLISQSSATARTPKLTVPTFDGTSDKWIKFRDLFESMIHNKTNLSNIEKFSYLHSSIQLPSGQTNVLDNFKVCDDDYQAAWAAICERYNDKRKIIAMHCATLFEVKKMSCESASELRRVIDEFSSQISALKQMGYVLGDADDFANVFIVQFALVRLDEHTLREWKKFRKEDTATWKQLCDFLTAQWRSLDDDAMNSLQPSNDAKGQQKPMKSLVAAIDDSNNHVASSDSKCSVCFDYHALWSCTKFLSMSVDERYQHVRNNQLCFNCLSKSHHSRNCVSKSRCKVCNHLHNSLLHFDKSITSASQIPTSEPLQLSAETPPFSPTIMKLKTNYGSSSKSHVSSHSAFRPRKLRTILSTVVIDVADVDGNFHSVRALLDNGSDDNFITSQLTRKLGLARIDVCVPLTGIGERSTIIDHQTETTISSRYGEFQTTLDFSVISSITGNVPSQSENIGPFGISSKHILADPEFNMSAPVDMLLNVDVFYNALLSEKIQLNNGPLMLHTKFGWIVGGSMQSPVTTNTQSPISCFAQANQQHDDYKKIVEPATLVGTSPLLLRKGRNALVSIMKPFPVPLQPPSPPKKKVSQNQSQFPSPPNISCQRIRYQTPTDEAIDRARSIALEKPSEVKSPTTTLKNSTSPTTIQCQQQLLHTNPKKTINQHPMLHPTCLRTK